MHACSVTDRVELVHNLALVAYLSMLTEDSLCQCWIRLAVLQTSFGFYSFHSSPQSTFSRNFHFGLSTQGEQMYKVVGRLVLSDGGG